DNAYPVLKIYKYPSAVFLVSDLVGNENMWDCEKIRDRKQLLDWDRILELKNNGVIFGSHSRTHPFLTALSEKELRDETEVSKTAIEEKLKSPVEFFCYPYGDYNEGVLSAVREAGYRAAITMRRGYVFMNDNPFEIRRVSIKLKTHPLSFLYRLHVNHKSRDESIA
ncbi:MAG TPA: polysaccharide deacetylase family protein, partial [Thermodesulfovibrionales bacterium]|nr:polysaccharide deacetylase family protein [Thermodesulfovibrionales bacterium]